jgi:hypothetical protein
MARLAVRTKALREIAAKPSGQVRYKVQSTPVGAAQTNAAEDTAKHSQENQ